MGHGVSVWADDKIRGCRVVRTAQCGSHASLSCLFKMAKIIFGHVFHHKMINSTQEMIT